MGESEETKSKIRYRKNRAIRATTDLSIYLLEPGRMHHHPPPSLVSSPLFPETSFYLYFPFPISPTSTFLSLRVYISLQALIGHTFCGSSPYG